MCVSLHQPTHCITGAIMTELMRHHSVVQKMVFPMLSWAFKSIPQVCPCNSPFVFAQSDAHCMFAPLHQPNRDRLYLDRAWAPRRKEDEFGSSGSATSRSLLGPQVYPPGRPRLHLHVLIDTNITSNAEGRCVGCTCPCLNEPVHSKRL